MCGVRGLSIFSIRARNRMSCTFLVTCLSRKIGSRVHVDARKTGLPRRELLGGAIWGDAMSALASARCSRRRGEYATINIRWEVWEGGRVTREGGEVVVVRGGGGRRRRRRCPSRLRPPTIAIATTPIAPFPSIIAIAPPSRRQSRRRRRPSQLHRRPAVHRASADH